MDRGIESDLRKTATPATTPGLTPRRDEPRRASDRAIAELANILRENILEIPTLGRVVHYVQCAGDPPEKHRVGIVVGAYGTLVADLCVFKKSANAGFTVDSVTFDAEGRRLGSWHWPERQ